MLSGTTHFDLSVLARQEGAPSLELLNEARRVDIEMQIEEVIQSNEIPAGGLDG